MRRPSSLVVVVLGGCGAAAVSPGPVGNAAPAPAMVPATGHIVLDGCAIDFPDAPERGRDGEVATAALITATATWILRAETGPVLEGIDVDSFLVTRLSALAQQTTLETVDAPPPGPLRGYDIHGTVDGAPAWTTLRYAPATGVVCTASMIGASDAAGRRAFLGSIVIGP